MSIVSNKSGSTPIFYYSKVGATSLNVVNNSLDSLYEFPKDAPTNDGQIIAFNTDGSSSFVDTAGNPNSLVNDNPLIIPDEGSVYVSDGLTSTGTNASNGLKITDIVNVDLPLISNNTANFNSGLNIQSFSSLPTAIYMDGDNNFQINNNQLSKTYFSYSSEYNFDNNIKINDGGQLLLYNKFDGDAISIRKDDILNGDFVISNKGGSKSRFQGSSEYTIDNDLKVGDFSTTKKIYVNDVELNGVSQGMLRALNLNLLVPTVEQTYDIVWSNLTPEEKLAWKGGDIASIDPVQSSTGNFWSFQKGVSNTKINWVLPIDLSIFTFQELQSVWAIVKFNNSTSVSTEGSLWFQIQAGVEPNPPYYRTRWNYCNPATAVNQFQYYYKIYALDTITLTTAGNLGKGQETDQQKFKGNPCDVEPNLWSIGLNKLVGSPTGITSPGYTLQPISSVALNTASNINNISIDVVAIGVNNYRFNLFYA